MSAAASVAPAPRGATKRCAVCQAAVEVPPGVKPRTAKRTRCDACKGVHLQTRSLAVVHPALPYARDPAAAYFVEVFPDGAPLTAIAEAMGITRSRAQQIEAHAVAKLADSLAVLERSSPASGMRAAVARLREFADVEHGPTLPAASAARKDRSR